MQIRSPKTDNRAQTSGQKTMGGSQIPGWKIWKDGTDAHRWISSVFSACQVDRQPSSGNGGLKRKML